MICIIDSGADMCAFPSEVGRYLGIKVEEGKSEMLKGIGGQASAIYYHEIEMTVCGHSFKVPVGFGEKIVFPVLGQDGFFDKFVIKFDFKNKEFELTRP